MSKSNSGNQGNVTELDAAVVTDGSNEAEQQAQAEKVHVVEGRGVVHQLSGKREFVTIAIGEQDESKYPVTLSLNGEAILVPRGIKVSLPQEYFNILRDSVKTVYSANLDRHGQSEGIDEGSIVPRFAFVHHGPDNRSQG